MIPLPAFLAAKWVPYAVAGVSVVALTVACAMYWYNRGYAASEIKHAQIAQEAAEVRLEQQKQVSKADLTAVTVTATRRASLVQTIKYIDRPADPVECVSPEWMHAYNDGVLAVIANSGSAD